MKNGRVKKKIWGNESGKGFDAFSLDWDININTLSCHMDGYIQGLIKAIILQRNHS